MHNRHAVIDIFCKVYLCFVKLRKITRPVVVIYCAVRAEVPDIWII